MTRVAVRSASFVLAFGLIISAFSSAALAVADRRFDIATFNTALPELKKH